MGRKLAVTVNVAMSVDGKIATARRENLRLGSSLDRRHMAELRYRADAILIGASTLRAEDPPLSRGPLRVVLSRSLDLSSSLKFWGRDEGSIILATTAMAPREKVEDMRRRCEVWKLGEERVDVRLLCDRLAERGVSNLLVEGGGETIFDFVRHDLVDEYHVTLCPWIIGGRQAPTMMGGDGLVAGDVRGLELVSVRQEGTELFLVYRRGAKGRG